jgi:cytochrome c553
MYLESTILRCALNDNEYSGNGTGLSLMNKRAVSGKIIFVIFIVIVSPAMAVSAPSGAELYKKHCSTCHPNATRMPNKRIVETMRNPRSIMPTFDQDKVSDRDADAIADYIRSQHAKKFLQ